MGIEDRRDPWKEMSRLNPDDLRSRKTLKEPRVLAPFEIRISMEQMKHQIIHAFTGYEESLTQEMEKALQYAIENFDFRGAVTHIINSELKKRVEESASNAISEVFWREGFREDLKEMMETALLDSLLKSRKGKITVRNDDQT